MTNFEIEKLLARRIDGEPLSAAETAALRQALEADPELLGAAAEQTAIDRLLAHRAVPPAGDDFAQKVRRRLEQDASRKIVPFYRSRWLLPIGAAAAAVVAYFAIDGGYGREARAVAWVTGSTGVDGFEGGRELRKGERLRFETGFVSIRFSKGAEVVLEGEADLEFTGPNRVKLHRGSAVANVPPSAHGFTIDGPGGKVVDIGTEFAVKTAGAGMEVHVLKGEVKAEASGHRAVSLKEDKALLLGKAGALGLVAAPGNFLTVLPPKHDGSPLRFLHWSFDENSGLEAKADGRGLPAGEEVNGALTSLPGSDIVPAWAPGVFGSAISFSGRNDYIQTEFPGFGGSSARTVACWVKVPEDLKSTEGYALVSWGAHASPGDTWQVSINPDKRDGPTGSMRVGTHEGQVVGSTDLRDGKWHHLVAVLYEGRPANVATHILLYVDGRLERAARKSVMRINTDITGPLAQRVAFGKNSAVRSADASMPRHTFRGGLDEVTLCPAALSPEEIARLMKNGRLQ